MVAYDLIVRGARVIDAALGLDGKADIAIQDGRVVQVADLGTAAAREVLDATGLYASPGWVDLHAHVFHSAGFNGVHPDRDAGLLTGVTTVVDPGSAGAYNWVGFRDYVIRPAATRVLAFLNISVAPGTPGIPRHGDWANFNQSLTVQTIEQNPDHIVGVKVLASQTHCGFMGLEPVKLAVQAAELTGTRVMCHIGNAPPVIGDVLSLLRPGDIVTHCWHGKPGGILGRDRRPISQAWEAAERGVLFDIGHGSASFSFQTARHALEAGFPVHSVSTDLHSRCLKGPVVSQAVTMSKLLHLGLGLPEVIRLATHGPAACIGRENQFGTLLPGSAADITLFRIEEGRFPLTDADGRTEEAERLLRPVHTVRQGRVVGCP